MYLDKGKIKTIYQAFKYYKWDWSKITIKPDVRGKFNPYLDDLLGDDIYDRTKLEQTQVLEQEKTKDKSKDRLKETIYNLSKKYKQTEIEEMTGIPRSTLRDWIKEIGGGGEKSI